MQCAVQCAVCAEIFHLCLILQSTVRQYQPNCAMLSGHQVWYDKKKYGTLLYGSHVSVDMVQKIQSFSLQADECLAALESAHLAGVVWWAWLLLAIVLSLILLVSLRLILIPLRLLLLFRFHLYLPLFVSFSFSFSSFFFFSFLPFLLLFLFLFLPPFLLLFLLIFLSLLLLLLPAPLLLLQVLLRAFCASRGAGEKRVRGSSREGRRGGRREERREEKVEEECCYVPAPPPCPPPAPRMSWQEGPLPSPNLHQPYAEVRQGVVQVQGAGQVQGAVQGSRTSVYV